MPRVGKRGSSGFDGDVEAVRIASEKSHLADAALALLGCTTAQDVFDLIGDFTASLLPDAIVIINEATPNADALITRAMRGLDDSLLAKAAGLFGFEMTGARWAMLPEYRREVVSGELHRLPGGVAGLLAREVPAPIAEASAKLFGGYDVYTIGIADGQHALGSVRILTRTSDDAIPAHIIESFVRHCYSALVGITKARELAEEAERNRLVLRHMSEGLALHEIILDSDGVPCDYRFLDVNPAYEATTGLLAKDIIGRTVREVLPDVESLWIERYGAVATTGVPARFEEYSAPLGKYYSISAYSPQPGQFVSVGLDTTEHVREEDARRHAEETLRQSERDLLEAQRIAHVGSWTYDPAADVIEWSAEMFRIWGLDPEQGPPSLADHKKLIHPDDAERFDLFSKAIQDGTPYRTEMRLLRPDGTERTVITSCEAVRDATGAVIGLRGINQDITQRKQAEEAVLRLNLELDQRVQERTAELTAANAELAEATRVKSDFLAAMSHELRTPLNSIIGFSDLLLGGMVGELEPEQEKQIGMINAAGKHLLSLVDDILDLSKIEAGQTTAVFQGIDVEPLAQRIVEMVHPMARDKGLELTLSCEPNVRTLVSDPRFVGQILTNLLGNAIKFTDMGSVSLEISARGQKLLFAVTDTGRGILPEDLPHIMERFYQAKATVGAKNQGAGLGLAISLSLAEMIGGEIDVVSEFRVGSTFTLKVPREPDTSLEWANTIAWT